MLALLFLVWLLTPHPVSALTCESDGRYVMGTVLEITLCAEYVGSVRQYLEPLFTIATHLDASLTTYDLNSPVSRLNASGGEGPASVPHEVSDLLTLSLRYSQLTQGTFDVTVGPLMLLWREFTEGEARE